MDNRAAVQAGKRADHSSYKPPGLPWLGNLDWIALGVLVLSAAIIRIVYLAQSADWPYFDQPLSDAALYLERARGILGGYWPPPNMAHSQGPLYPYLLAVVLAITDGHHLMLYIQMVLGCAAIALIYLTARRGGGLLAGIVAGVLVLGYGPLVAIEGKLLTESLATFLSLLVAYGLVRQVDRIHWSWIVVTGVALGAASALRPSFLLAMPLAAGWIYLRHWLLRRRAAVPAIALWAIAGATIAPFTYQNIQAEGQFIPLSSAGGITFFLGNNPAAAGTLSYGGVISGGVSTQNEEQLSRAESVLGRKLTSSEASTFWYKRGLVFISRHPTWWAWIMWRKFRLFFSSLEIANVYTIYVERSVIPVLRALAMPFGVIGALGVVGMVLTLRKPHTHALLVLLGVGFFTCMAFYTSSRFRMPMVPLIAVLGGWGVERVIGLWREKRSRATLLSLGSAIVLAVLMLWPVRANIPSPILFGRRNLAQMLARSGEPERAIEILRPQLDAEVHADDRANAYLALGRIQIGRHRYKDAIDALEKAIDIDPENFAPYPNLAEACYRMGRYQEAIDHARTLLEHNARDLSCRVIVAKALLRQRKWADAREELTIALETAPNHPSVLYLLAQAHIGLHQYDKAIESLQRSLRGERNVDVMLMLAQCHAKIDQKDQARAVLLGILARDPDHTKAQAFLRQLGGLGRPTR